MNLAEIEQIAAAEARPITAGDLTELREEIGTGFAGTAAEDLAWRILDGLMDRDPTVEDVWDLIDEIMEQAR